MPSTTSTSSPGATKAQTKRCIDCCALQPIQAFGLARRFSDGYSTTCKLCRSQDNSFKWTEKHGRKNKMHQFDMVRSVRRQNGLILDAAFAAGRMEFRGFDYISLGEYKLYYGPSERLGLNALTMFTRNGEVFMELALSGVKDHKAVLMAFLKDRQVRLELSDVDVIQSKTQIYFL